MVIMQGVEACGSYVIDIQNYDVGKHKLYLIGCQLCFLFHPSMLVKQEPQLRQIA